jgi:hypothetical protein
MDQNLEPLFNILGAADILDAEKKFFDLWDKTLLEKQIEIDFFDKELLINQVKTFLVKHRPKNVIAEEQSLRQEILSEWFKEAIAHSLFVKKDRVKAKELVKEALIANIGENEDQIYSVLNSLLQNNVDEAKARLNNLKPGSYMKNESAMYVEAFEENKF